jgi:phage baseplate assembly protein W
MSASGTSSHVAIKLPFSFGSNGLLETTSDYRTIWKDRVRSVLLTAKYERVNRPEFGSAIYEEVFSGVGMPGGAEERIAAAIYAAFAEQLAPALQIKDVSADYDYSTGALYIEVSYKLPNDSDDSLTINTLSINKSAPPTFVDLFTEGA